MGICPSFYHCTWNGNLPIILLLFMEWESAHHFATVHGMGVCPSFRYCTWNGSLSIYLPFGIEWELAHIFFCPPKKFSLPMSFAIPHVSSPCHQRISTQTGCSTLPVLYRENDLLATFPFQHIHVKAALELHVTVNEKCERRYTHLPQPC